MKLTMTYHTQVERADRIDKIIDNIGMGEPYVITKTYPATYGPAQKILTTTGIIIIKSENNRMITCYVATVHEALACCNHSIDGCKRRLPKEMFAMIERHEKRKYHEW